jgi:protein-disulfide isomerase
MFNPFRSPKFSVKLFVIASISSFIILGFFYLYLTIAFNYKPNTAESAADRYYLNTGYAEGDPLITKKPSLKDMLSGPIISSLDPAMGYADAPVAIVEFSDFTCLYCQKQEQIIKKIMQNYKDQVKLLWKDYPDSNINSLSYKSAVAARCAGEQDAFWPFHDFLYEKKDKLNEASFLEIAGLLKLNKNKLAECMESGRTKQLINDNIEEANALAITGIPFIYINNQEIMGETAFEEINRIIQIELNKLKKKF